MTEESIDTVLTSSTLTFRLMAELFCKKGELSVEGRRGDGRNKALLEVLSLGAQNRACVRGGPSDQTVVGFLERLLQKLCLVMVYWITADMNVTKLLGEVAKL